MKRFYKTVSVEQNEDGYLVLLDGKSIKTPGGGVICLNNENTAKLIANDWDSVPEDSEIDPRKMPYMTLASTAIDKIIPNMDEIKVGLCAYAMNELVCYREGDNQKLIELQNDNWDSEIEWAKTELNMPLKTTTGITPVKQDEAVHDSAVGICNEMDGFGLTCFADFVGNLGSFVLSASLIRGRLDMDTAWDKAHIDESFQNIQWGEDEERKNIMQATKNDLQNTLNFYNSLKK